MMVCFRRNWLFIQAVILLLAACTVEAPPTEAAQTGLPDFLESLRQISDYPFYEAYYIGDYGLGRFLENGEYPRIEMEEVLVDACSCFYAEGEGDAPIMGRNFDWHEQPVLVLFTDPPDGYASVSMVDISYLGYDSEHTPLDDPEGLFYAPYYVFDGMNEQGLAVGMMAVGHAEGGRVEENRTVGSLELMRVMLDYAINTYEALEVARNFNIDFGSVPVHYLVADSFGKSVVIEYLNGEAVMIEGNGKWQTSTNFIIAEEKPHDADSSCWRYNHIENKLSLVGGKVNAEEGMKLLKSVSQGGQNGTRWSVVYDLKNKSMSAVINRDFTQVYTFKLD